MPATAFYSLPEHGARPAVAPNLCQWCGVALYSDEVDLCPDCSKVTTLQREATMKVLRKTVKAYRMGSLTATAELARLGSDDMDAFSALYGHERTPETTRQRLETAMEETGPEMVARHIAAHVRLEDKRERAEKREAKNKLVFVLVDGYGTIGAHELREACKKSNYIRINANGLGCYDLGNRLSREDDKAARAAVARLRKILAKLPKSGVQIIFEREDMGRPAMLSFQWKTPVGKGYIHLILHAV